jgi:hypothetical protein
MSGYTEERAREFLSVGVRAISPHFGLSAEDCQIRLEREDVAPRAATHNRFSTGAQEPNERLDYRVKAKIVSPWSSTLSQNQTDKDDLRQALLGIDHELSDKFDYRAKLDADVDAALRSENKSVVSFSIGLNLTMQRKSRFAKAKHFAGFDGVNNENVVRTRQLLSRLLMEAYMSTLTDLGLEITQGTHSQ